MLGYSTSVQIYGVVHDFAEGKAYAANLSFIKKVYSLTSMILSLIKIQGYFWIFAIIYFSVRASAKVR